MSTTTPFQHLGRWLPFIERWNDSPSPPLGGPFNSVDVPAEVASNLAWNLEDLEIVTTGTRGGVNLGYTFTLGATEAMPFGSIVSRTGLYYRAGVPAQTPSLRLVADTATAIQENIIFCNFADSSPDRQFLLRILVGSFMPTSQLVRLYYLLSIREVSGTDAVQIVNPAAAALFGGTPASSGNLTILGTDFPWQGGGRNLTTWGAEPATLSATSAAFTY